MSNKDSAASSRWVGYEMHDGLLQWVIAARMNLETTLALTRDPALRKKIKQSMRYIELAIDEGRELIGFLDELPEHTQCEFQAIMQQFSSSIAILIEEHAQTIELIPSQPPWPELRQSLLWNLLRIAQQAVRNAVQHAGPAAIQVASGWQDDQHLWLSISDTGKGFDPQSQQAKCSSTSHFGVSSIRHRAQLIGARLTIDSSPGNGCRIRLVIPLHGSAQE